MSNPNKLIVIVLGSHRSGTSVITKLVSYLGFNLGVKLMEPNRDNPKGYFEDVDIYNLNEKILKAIDRNWYDIDFIDRSVLVDLTNEKIFNEAISLIKEKIKDNQTIIIKDPRISILLPFWTKVFEKLELSTKYVCSIRNPLDVSLSLNIRDRIQMSTSLNIWYRYTSQLLIDLEFKDTIFINFNNFNKNLNKEIVKLEFFFKKKFNNDSLKEFKYFYETSLVHSQFILDDFYKSNLINHLYKEIFSHYLELSGYNKINSSLEKSIKKNVNKIQNILIADPLYDKSLVTSTSFTEKFKNDLADLLKQRDKAITQIANLEHETKIKTDRATTQISNLERESKIKTDRATTQISNLEHENKIRDDALSDLSKQRDRATTQISNLEQEIKIKTNRAITQIANLERETKIKTDSAIDQIANLEHENKIRDDALSDLSKQRDRAATHISNLENDMLIKDKALSKALNQRNINIEQINALSLQRDIALTDLRNVINSRSMKLTAPLRFFLNNLKYTIFIYNKIIKKLKNIYKNKTFIQSLIKFNFNIQDIFKLKSLYNYILSNNIFNKNLEDISTNFNSRPIEISIIIPVYNKWNYTVSCIKSIFDQDLKYTFEVIIMDDNSIDLMPNILVQAINKKPNIIKYYKNKSNLGFIKNCNTGSMNARGEFIVFLNNDTLVNKNWLIKLRDTFNQYKNIGVVGSKILFENNTLQEAGGIIWDDASGMNYGRNKDASHPRFNYLREVSYVSGCSFMVNKELFIKTGGFDEELNTAYYEDAAKCFQLSNLGYKIIYQPESSLIHYEGVTNGKDIKKGVKRFQETNKEIFYNKYIAPLMKSKYKPLSKPDNELDIILASERNYKERILVIDNNIPTPDKDEGSQYMWNLLKYLKNDNNLIKFIAAEELTNTRNEYFRNLKQIGIEVGEWPHYLSVNDFIKKNRNIFSVILITRVNNHKKYYKELKENNKNAKIIFNTIDLHHLRHLREAEVLNSDLIKKEALELKEIEIECINKSDRTILVSSQEYKYLNEIGVKVDDVHVLPLLRDFISKTEIKSFNSRKDSIVFLGNFNHTPNVDAINFLINDIWPKLENECVKRNIKLPFLDIVGDDMPDAMKYMIKNLKFNIKYHGYVKDLEKFFEDVKLSIAPLRYGAGLKGKIITSFQFGVPVIGSLIAFEGINHKKINTGITFISENADEYVNSIITLITNENEWYKLSKSLIKFVNDTYSIDKNKNIIKKIFY